MVLEIRHARVEDIPHLSWVLIQAWGGCADVMYKDVIPGRTLEQIVEHRLSRSGTTSGLGNSRIAADGETVMGGLHAYPMDLAEQDPPDPLIAEERSYVAEPFRRMHADGSYYIDAVAVYPEYRGRGIARRLMEEALAEAAAMGFDEVSLYVFAENRRAVRLYEFLGYREAAREPVVYHPDLKYGGDLLLMKKNV